MMEKRYETPDEWNVRMAHNVVTVYCYDLQNYPAFYLGMLTGEHSYVLDLLRRNRDLQCTQLRRWEGVQ